VKNATWWQRVLVVLGGFFVVLLLVGVLFLTVVGGILTFGPREAVRATESTEAVEEPEASPVPDPPKADPTETTYTGTTETTGGFVPEGVADPVSWTLVELAKFFDTVEVAGLKWVLPLGTHFATDLSNGRYEAVESSPVGPQPNGTNAGWCGEGQLDCPPHLGLYRVEVPEGVEAMMDIATRIQVTSDDGGELHFQWMFNTESRSAAELMDDYDVAASGGQLGLFIAVADPIMDPATLVYRDKELTLGYGCWDCLAHTSGKEANIVSLDDPSIGHFGSDTATLGDSLWPAYVILVPSPQEDPDFTIDLMVEIPEGTTAVLWFGRYDVSDPLDG